MLCLIALWHAAAGLVILLYGACSPVPFLDGMILNRSEDHLLTLDEEIQYVWKARWTLPKAMFLANRYGVLILTIMNTWREWFCAAP